MVPSPKGRKELLLIPFGVSSVDDVSMAAQVTEATAELLLGSTPDSLATPQPSSDGSVVLELAKAPACRHFDAA